MYINQIIELHEHYRMGLRIPRSKSISNPNFRDGRIMHALYFDIRLIDQDMETLSVDKTPRALYNGY